MSRDPQTLARYPRGFGFWGSGPSRFGGGALVGTPKCWITFLRFFVLVGLILQVVVVRPSIATSAQAQDSAFRRLGVLERFPEDARTLLGADIVNVSNAGSLYQGTLIPIPAVRQLWQIWQGAKTYAVVRDLDTLKIVKALEIPIINRGAYSGDGGEWLHAVDEEGQRLFLMRVQQDLVVVDLTDFRLKRLEFGSFPRSGGFVGDTSTHAVRTSGISWDPKARRIWSTYGKEATAIDPYANNFLVRINPDVPEGGRPVEGSRLLRGCRGPLPGNFTADSRRYLSRILRWGDYLHIPCHRDLGSTAIAILKADEALNVTQSEELLVGPAVTTLSVLADETAGRLHFITDDSQDWVWNADSKAFVGTVALGGGRDVGSSRTLTVGLDREFGRLYLFSKNFGLGFVESRYTPVGQARIFSEEWPGSRQITYEMIHVDPPTRRIFALLPGLEEVYTILGVPPPAPRQSVPDPDENTVNVSEQAGITTADFAGSAGGYGMRVLLAGGLVKVIPMPVFNFDCCPSPLAEFFNANNSKCGYADREMAAGDVVEAKVSTYASRAAAFGFSLDERSQQNLRVPSQCDLETSLIPGFKGVFAAFPKQECPPGAIAPDCSQYWERQIAREWNPASAQCSRPGSDPISSPGSPPLGSASVSCPEDPGAHDQSLFAFAFGEVEGPVLRGGGYTKTTIYKDSDRGLVSRAESVAREVTIAIGGVSASMGEIRSLAESWSNGRPGEEEKPRSSRVVTISGFVGPDGVRCSQCDVKAVIDALNVAFVGRAFFRQGVHDERLYRGSPRGAQTAVQKSDSQRSSDRAVAGDGRSEVPALEIITYNDTPPWGRARQIYQLAGVKTASTYNLSCIRGITTDGECAGPPPPSPAVLTITLTDDSAERRPLEGGVFGLYRDAAGDGLLDELTDDLVKLGDGKAALCSSGQDGVGNCKFDEVAPGPYVIRQVAAPQSYVPIKDFAITLVEGLVHKVTFTNLRAKGAIEIALTNDAATPGPLAGGVFEVFADNGNQALDVSDLQAGSCTTGQDGTCGFGEVPLGGYLVRQSEAPADYLRVEELQPVKIELPGQVARLAFRNGLSGIEAEPPSLSSQPVELVFEDLPPSQPQVSVSSPAPASPPVLPGVVGSVAEGIRVLLSSPREAAIIASVWMLFLSPLLVGGRRRLLRTISTEGR